MCIYIVKTITFVRINDDFDVHCVVNKLTKGEDQFIDNSHGRFRLTPYVNEDGITFYSYGLKSNGMQPGHGGEWSSRPSVINDVFGVNLIGCNVKQIESEYSSWFVMAINQDDVDVPDCLEYSPCKWVPEMMGIHLKDGIEFPRGKDYFRSTTLDANGVLIYPV